MRAHAVLLCVALALCAAYVTAESKVDEFQQAPAHLSSKYTQRPTYISPAVLKLLPNKVAASLVTQTSKDEMVVPDRPAGETKLSHPMFPEMRFREQFRAQRDESDSPTPIRSASHHVDHSAESDAEQPMAPSFDRQGPASDMRMMGSDVPYANQPAGGYNPYAPSAPGAPMQMPQVGGSPWAMNPQAASEMQDRPLDPRFVERIRSNRVPLPSGVLAARMARMRQRKAFRSNYRFQQATQRMPMNAPMPMMQPQAPAMEESAPMMQEGLVSPPQMPNFGPSPALQAAADVDLPGADAPQFRNLPPAFGMLEESASLKREAAPKMQRAPRAALESGSRVPFEVSEPPTDGPDLIELGEKEAASLGAGLNVASEVNAAAEESAVVPNLAPTSRVVSHERDPSIPEPPAFEAGPAFDQPQRTTVQGIPANKYDPVQLNREVFG